MLHDHQQKAMSSTSVISSHSWQTLICYERSCLMTWFSRCVNVDVCYIEIHTFFYCFKTSNLVLLNAATAYSRRVCCPNLWANSPATRFCSITSGFYACADVKYLNQINGWYMCEEIRVLGPNLGLLIWFLIIKELLSFILSKWAHKSRNWIVI